MVHTMFSHHLVLVTLRNVLLCTDTRVQIDHEAENVESEDKRDGPFEAGCDIFVGGEGGADEDDSEDQLDEDECKLEPEAEGEDSVVSVVDTESLIFCAQEDCRDNVAADEDEEADIVGRGMTVGV